MARRWWRDWAASLSTAGPRGGASPPLWWRTPAAGATSTRAPATWARQQRSTSAPWSPISGSNPPSSLNRSLRTSRQVLDTANTSLTASCCSWSSSPRSTTEAQAPVLSTARPTSSSRSGWSHSTTLGADDAGVGPQRLLDQQADGVGLHGHVVVAEDEERGALHRLEDVVGGGREPGPVGTRRR